MQCVIVHVGVNHDAGENGKTFFFQCELPYDVTPAYGTAGYVGYRVNDNVKTHVGYGVGVYSNFVAVSTTSCPH